MKEEHFQHIFCLQNNGSNKPLGSPKRNTAGDSNIVLIRCILTMKNSVAAVHDRTYQRNKDERTRGLLFISSLLPTTTADRCFSDGETVPLKMIT